MAWWTTSCCTARTSATGTDQRAAAAASEHVAGRRSNVAHRHKNGAAARAIDVLVAVAGFVGLGLDNLYAVPARFHFVGYDHRQAGAHTGSHLRAMCD
ncbi:hypothetical protein ACTMU2_16385 [Cupriavidus basilensis]